MSPNRLPFVALATVLTATAAATVAQGQPHPAKLATVTSHHARFTVVTRELIRIEYSPTDAFVDAPSTFAADRGHQVGGWKISNSDKALTIDTGAIRLTYTPDGNPLSASNLKAVIHGKTWTPSAPNPGNLGGTIRTLDGVRGPVDLGQGVLSRDGWFLLDDSRSPLLTGGWVQSRPANSGSDWYLFGYGDDYRGALQSLTAIGGAVPMPRKYALGAWYSRYWPYTSAEFRQIVDQYGQHGFPLDNIVMDMDWHRDGWTGWSWNRKLLPDAEDLLKWFHEQGLHTTLNMHPADGVGPWEDAYPAFMRDMGEDPASQKTIPFDPADKKYADAWFKDVLEPLEKEGVDFWWLDWQQYPYTRSVPDLTNLFWLNTLLYGHTSEPDERGMSFSRWAGWGDHRHPIHFSGDANTGFPMLAFEVPFTSTAGNVGCFFWSHDIGGHMGGRNEESYTRWVQFGATSPVLRSHSTRDATTDRRPWNYPAWAEDSMRRSFHLRSELFPYLYTSAWESTRDSIPLDRPMYLDYGREERAYHNAQQFLMGDNLLVAPIVAAGVGPGRVGRQTVWFPKGAWYDYFTGERYAGDSEALVSADINEFPLYVRAGVPVPMQPYTPRMSTTPLTKLVLRCYPGEDGKVGRSTLYEDDGVTVAYRRGASATTALSYVRHGDEVEIRVGATHGRYAGQPARRAVELVLPDTGRAESVEVNGAPASSAYDASEFVNRIEIPAQPIGGELTVVVRVAPAGAEALRARAEARRFAGVLGHPAADLKAALAEPNLAPDARDAVLAVAGIGVVDRNDSPTLYHGTVRPMFYAPAGVQAQVANRSRRLDGRPLDLSTTSHLRRGETIYDPQPIAFEAAGQTITLTPPVSNPSELESPDNVARIAHVTGEAESGYRVAGAVDGVLGGYPDNGDEEWSAGATVGATLRLDWDKPQTVDRIVLYDRPNEVDQVTSGEIEFSDGAVLPFGALPDDGKKGLELRFPAKTITSLTFKVLSVKPGTENAGLSEIAVYRAK